MPLVETKDLLVPKQLLDADDHVDFPDARRDEISTVDVEEQGLEGFSAFMFDQNDWHDEDDEIVDERPEVQHLLNTGHDQFFNFLDLLRIVLESESLVLIMDQGLPAPDWEDDFLPAGNGHMVMLMVVVLQNLSNRHE